MWMIESLLNWGKGEGRFNNSSSIFSSTKTSDLSYSSTLSISSMNFYILSMIFSFKVEVGTISNALTGLVEDSRTVINPAYLSGKHNSAS